MKKMIAFALVALMTIPAIAFAQHTITVSADPDGAAGSAPFTQVFDTPAGGTFDLVVWMDTAGEASNAAEFVMTELLVEAPGVLKTGTVKINGALDLGDNALGEYVLALRGCLPATTEWNLVRLTYLQFSLGVIPNDMVLSLRGFQQGDTQPSTFNGAPGFVDCAENKFPMTMGGVDGGTTGSGVVFPDGSLALNPTPVAVPTLDNSIGQLKARF